MATARSGIDNLMAEIVQVENSLKNSFGKTAGRVKIANAKTAASYSVSKNDDFMRWHVEYLNNLKGQL
jgi:hypothetical protein